MSEKSPIGKRAFFPSIMEVCPLCNFDCTQRYVKTISDTEQIYHCEDCDRDHVREAWFVVDKTSEADFVGPIV